MRWVRGAGGAIPRGGVPPATWPAGGRMRATSSVLAGGRVMRHDRASSVSVPPLGERGDGEDGDDPGARPEGHGAAGRRRAAPRPGADGRARGRAGPRPGPGGGLADGAGEAQRQELPQAAQAGRRARGGQRGGGAAGGAAAAGVAGRPVRAGRGRVPGGRQDARPGRAG